MTEGKTRSDTACHHIEVVAVVEVRQLQGIFPNQVDHHQCSDGVEAGSQPSNNTKGRVDLTQTGEDRNGRKCDGDARPQNLALEGAQLRGENRVHPEDDAHDRKQDQLVQYNGLKCFHGKLLSVRSS